MASATQLEKGPPRAVAGGGWLDRFAGLATQLRIRWSMMHPSQRFWTLTSGALVTGLLGGVLWWGLRTDWRTLYADMDPEDARATGLLLAQAQIPYDTTPNGAGIRVPAELLDKARLATAAKGGVKSGRLGFEIFDKPNWVGSEFDEQVNYQRALEGELEHTVGSLADVASARVHLVMTHDSLFRDQERPAKASVVLKLRHRNLADGEAESIRNLVASAVDGLTPDRVVLVDGAGHLPLGPKSPDAMRLTAEEILEEKLVATLEPVTGAGNVRASVSLDYDPTATEQTEETYDPDQTATLSMQRTDQTSGPQAVAAGIPGTASNTPNAQAVQATPLPVYPGQTTPPQTAKTESATYGVSKTLKHSAESSGRLRRLTAAIVVNDRLQQVAVKGKPAVWQSRSPDELRNLTALAQATVGFDTARGDLVTVEDLAFEGNRAATPTPLASQALSAVQGSPQLVRYAAWMAGLLVVLTFAVRPALKQASMAAPAGGRSAGRELSDGQAAAAAAALRAPAQNQLDAERVKAQEILEQVSNHLSREPSQSSRLLQSWIHTD